MARTAEVVSGMRGGQQQPVPLAPETRNPVRQSDGEVVYVARAARYVLQLIAADDIYNSLEGTRIKGKSVAAKFREHIFRTSDPKIIALMESKKDYGLGRDYWRQEDEAKAAINGKVDTLVAQLKAVDPALLDPALRSKLADALGADIRSEFVPAD